MRLEQKDIVFNDYVDCSDAVLSAYLEENDTIDKIAGLFNETLDAMAYNGELCLSEIYNINYYVCFDVETKEVSLEASITIYEKEALEDLRNICPEFVDNIYRVGNGSNPKDYKVELTKEEMDLILEEFKKYVYKDLSDTYSGSTFEEVVNTYIYDELGVDRD